MHLLISLTFAHYGVGEKAVEEMKNLRAKMPSIMPLLTALHKNITDTDSGKFIKARAVCLHVPFLIN